MLVESPRVDKEDPHHSRRVVARALRSDNARDLVADAKLAAPKLAEAIKPCGPEGVRLQCERLALVFGVPPGRNDKHWTAVAAEYVDALQAFPMEALVNAATDYRNHPDSKFFPKPGQLRALARPHAERLRIAAYRAKLLAEAEEKAEPPEPSAEEKEERRRMAEEVRKAVGAGLKRMPADPPAPRPGGFDPATDPYLQSLKQSPIRRGPAEPEESELFS